MCAILYKIAICDDDEDFARRLEKEVVHILQERNIAFAIHLFSSGEMLVEDLNKNNEGYDVYFLDIYMKEMNGLDTARAIRRTSHNAAIIMTTSSEKHVFFGYEVQALQYLIKPIDIKTLTSALTVDLKRRYENRFLVFKSAGIIKKVPYDEIQYFESMVKTVRIVSTNGTLEFLGLISDLENTLPKLSFFRCHRGFIINFKYISQISANTIVTSNGAHIPIGKTYARAVSRAFLDFISG